MTMIRLDLSVAEILDAFPETLDVFTANGLNQFADEKVRQVLAPVLKLGTALRARGVNADLFRRLLEERIADTRLLREESLANFAGGQGLLTLLALMPCGVKMPFTRAMEGFLEGLPEQTARAFRHVVEGNLNQELSYYPYVGRVEDIAELPDLILTADINSFYYHNFRRKFIETGHFVDVTDYPANASFAGCAIQDPARRYTMLCVNPLVIVADQKRLAGRPLPRRWLDLCDPRWRRSITMRGDGEFFCHAVLLPLFKEHGGAAVAALGRNIDNGWHPAQMVKEAGNGQDEGAALYVMPEFFARKIVCAEAVEIIWPEDGAVVSPVSLLVKRDKAVALKPVTDYLTGPELAKVFAGAYFPAVHPAAENRHAPGARFKWLGWDFFAAHDIEALNAEIDRHFLPAWKEGRR